MFKPETKQVVHSQLVKPETKSKDKTETKQVVEKESLIVHSQLVKTETKQVVEKERPIVQGQFDKTEMKSSRVGMGDTDAPFREHFPWGKDASKLKVKKSGVTKKISTESREQDTVSVSPVLEVKSPDVSLRTKGREDEVLAGRDAVNEKVPQFDVTVTDTARVLGATQDPLAPSVAPKALDIGEGRHDTWLMGKMVSHKVERLSVESYLHSEVQEKVEKDCPGGEGNVSLHTPHTQDDQVGFMGGLGGIERDTVPQGVKHVSHESPSRRLPSGAKEVEPKLPPEKETEFSLTQTLHTGVTPVGNPGDARRPVRETHQPVRETRGSPGGSTAGEQTMEAAFCIHGYTARSGAVPSEYDPQRLSASGTSQFSESKDFREEVDILQHGKLPPLRSVIDRAISLLDLRDLPSGAAEDRSRSRSANPPLRGNVFGPAKKPRPLSDSAISLEFDWRTYEIDLGDGETPRSRKDEPSHRLPSRGTPSVGSRDEDIVPSFMRRDQSSGRTKPDYRRSRSLSPSKAAMGFFRKGQSASVETLAQSSGTPTQTPTQPGSRAGKANAIKQRAMQYISAQKKPSPKVDRTPTVSAAAASLTPSPGSKSPRKKQGK